MKLSLVHSLSFAVFDQAVFISTAIPKNCNSLEAGASLPDPFARGRHEDQSAAAHGGSRWPDGVRYRRRENADDGRVDCRVRRLLHHGGAELKNPGEPRRA